MEGVARLALRPGRRNNVRRVASEEHTPMPPLLDDSRAEDVIGNTDNLGIVLGQVSADARPDSFVLSCFFGRWRGPYRSKTPPNLAHEFFEADTAYTEMITNIRDFCGVGL